MKQISKLITAGLVAGGLALGGAVPATAATDRIPPTVAWVSQPAGRTVKAGTTIPVS